MKTVSIAIAVYNEEKNLANCLASVCDWAKEIVVVDGGSSDATVDIASAFGAKIIKTDNPPIFHINKQKALDACTGIWILQLDADEVVSKELVEEIDTIAQSNKRTANGYYIPRKNFFLGHWLRKGGQYPDYVIRFFKNGKGKFPKKSVHEQIEISGSIDHLKGHLFHYSYPSLEEYSLKADRYTSLVADELAKSHTKKNIKTAIQYFVVKPAGTFFSLFIRHKGFVDLWYGFLYAFLSSLHHPASYKKYLNRK